MKTRRFADPQMQKVYTLYRNVATSDFKPRRTGGGLAAAYFRGCERPDRQQYLRTSLAYAAWAAGVDTVRS